MLLLLEEILFENGCGDSLLEKGCGCKLENSVQWTTERCVPAAPFAVEAASCNCFAVSVSLVLRVAAICCRAAKSDSMRSTFVVDKKDQKRARLSWYHPDDTVRRCR
jgi:hypothetical protein